MNGEKKRVSIFNKYSTHLQIIERQGLLGGWSLHFDETYICPICLEQFSRISLYPIAPNVLTLEDVPPKALGGSANLLTCFSCNNFSGVEFDHHLASALKQYDQKRFLPNTKTPIEIEYTDYKVQGEINVLEDGTINVFHKIKGNDPRKLGPYIEKVKPNMSVFVNFKQKPADRKKISVALLKIAYLLAFKHYGYALILDPVYDIVRRQLMYPELDLYPQDYWFMSDFPFESTGVPFVTEPGKRCILSIFYLKTLISKTQISVYLPLPGNSINSSYNNIRSSVKQAGEYELQMMKFESNNCLFDPLNFKTQLEKYI